MFLKLTLNTGEELQIPFDNTTALTVTTIQNVDGVQTEKVEAHADIASIELVEGDATPQPEITTMTGEQANTPQGVQDRQVPIGSEDPNQPADGAVVGGGQSDREGGDPGDVGPAGTPNPTVAHAMTDDPLGPAGAPTGDPVGEKTQQLAAGGDFGEGSNVHEEAAAIVDGEDPNVPQAVSDSIAAGDVPQGTVDADVPPHDVAVADAESAVAAAETGAHADHIQSALDDVNAALQAYPDSAQLQDAKSQLEQQLNEA